MRTKDLFKAVNDKITASSQSKYTFVSTKPTTYLLVPTLVVGSLHEPFGLVLVPTADALTPIVTFLKSICPRPLKGVSNITDGNSEGAFPAGTLRTGISPSFGQGIFDSSLRSMVRVFVAGDMVSVDGCLDDVGNPDVSVSAFSQLIRTERSDGLTGWLIVGGCLMPKLGSVSFVLVAVIVFRTKIGSRHLAVSSARRLYRNEA